MTLPSSTAFENIWGLALLALGILLPRIYLRARRPSAIEALDPTKLSIATIAAISGSLSLVAVAPLMGAWSWIYAVPMPSALKLMQRESNYEYIFGALVAWLFVAHHVVPLAALLRNVGRWSTPYLVTASSCGALVLGCLVSLAWPKPTQAITFVVASTLSLALSSSMAFAVALRIPWSLKSSTPSAA